MNKGTRLLCVLSFLLISACGLIVESGREVVVEIGEEDVIRIRDLQSRIREMPFAERAQANDTNRDVRMNVRREVLLSMVIEKLMVREAQARGLEASEQEIEQMFARQEEQEASPDGEHDDSNAEIDEGRDGHEQHNHTQWEIEGARKSLLIDKLKAEVFSREELRKHFEKTTKKYELEVTLYGFEILAFAPENASIVDNVYRVATERNLSLFAAYEALGKPEGILIGGLTPPTPLDMLLPEIRKELERLKYGEISKPFHYTEGSVERYATIRMATIHTRKPLRMVREEVGEDLHTEVVKNLHAKYHVVYHDDKLDYSVGE